jgi:hypothetical protein
MPHKVRLVEYSAMYYNVEVSSNLHLPIQQNPSIYEAHIAIAQVPQTRKQNSDPKPRQLRPNPRHKLHHIDTLKSPQ